MRYLSLCSGIEAASVAWQPLGWQAVAFAEIEPFPCAVLAHHYPDVPNLGDISAIDGRRYRGATELVIGGTPCQDFSIAGKRAGLDGERSGLVRQFMRLLSEVRPQWFIWENVPGVLSSGGGADFKAILNDFDDCGYSCAWRVLDAQFFGVPQRRRRVFVVGYFGDWRTVAKVLFEREGVCRDITQGGKKRQNIAACLKGGSGNRGWTSGAEDNFIAVKTPPSKAFALRTTQTSANGQAVLAYAPPIVEQAISCKWAKGSSGPAGDEHHNLITYAPQIAPSMSSSGPPYERTGNERVEADALVCSKFQVRRLMPVECERLQGFPDDYTNIIFRGKPATDSPRYKALGNSMAVPVIRWLGKRIQQAEENRSPAEAGQAQIISDRRLHSQNSD